MHNKNSKTALLLDDHVIIRDSCRSLLEQENFLITWEGGNGDQALKAYHKLQPSLCIIDLSIEGMSGLETIEKIIALDQTAKIIVFSMHNDSMFISKVLNLGVFGYVTKTSPPSNLTTAIKHAMRGKYFLSSDIDTKHFHSEFNYRNNPVSTLTKQERNIFFKTVQGLNSTAIGKELDISTKSVSYHLINIKQKLGAKNIPDLIKIALSHGFNVDNKYE